MGRTGGGSSGSHRSSGSGHSVSRASGGHRVGMSTSSSTRRTGSGTSSMNMRSNNTARTTTNTRTERPPVRQSNTYERRDPMQTRRDPMPGMTPPPPRPNRGGYMPPPPPPPRPEHHHHHYGGGPTVIRETVVHESSASSPAITAAVLIWSIIVFFCISMIFVSIFSGGGKEKNTVVRERLESGIAYDNDCVDDQIGWMDNPRTVATGLKEFWEETGVQPYIILKADDGSLNSDAEKDDWAATYYDTEIDREDAFLYVYFYENGEEYSDVPSYMTYTCGYQTSSVMDSLAVETFWNYLDRYWVTDMSTDELFVKTFTSTGNTIMHVSTTGKDLVKWCIILVLVAVIGGIIIKVMKLRFAERRARAAEDERILNTRISGLDDNPTQDLEDRYL